MACNKVSYETKTEALADIKYQKAQNVYFSKRKASSRKDKKLRPYQCRNCNKWHLTSMKQKSKVVKHVR